MFCQQHSKGISEIAYYEVFICSKSPLVYFRFGTFEEHFLITTGTQRSRPLGLHPWPADGAGNPWSGNDYTACVQTVSHANITGLGLLLICQVNSGNQTGKPDLIDILDLVFVCSANKTDLPRQTSLTFTGRAIES
jgi:hypothetical protein